MMGFFSAGSLPVINNTPRIAQCGACGLHKKCKSPKLGYVGRGLKEILIVSEAPGKEEDDAGRLLVGNSSRHLVDMLKKADINLMEDCWLTNSVICKPTFLGNDTKVIDYCRPNLINTINTLRPKVVILLGGAAVKSLISHCWRPEGVSTSRWAGMCIPAQKINAWIVPTYHPAYLLRMEDPVLNRQAQEHIRLASSKTKHPWKTVPDFRKEIIVSQNQSQTLQKLRSVKSGIVAFDYETDRLKPDTKDAQIVSCGICHNGEWTIAYPWVGKEVIEETKRILKDPNIGKIASNLKFEQRWTIAKLGLRVKNWCWDTMLAAHALDSRNGITSIKFLSFVYFGMESYDEGVSPYLYADGGNNPNKIKKLDTNALLLYNGLDCLLEYKVALKQAKEMGVKL